MIAFEIPLTPQPQSFSISLAGTTYSMRMTWNRASECWILDISDEDGQPLVNGIPVVTGLDLLEQYQFLGIAGALLAQSDFDANAVPTFENLGVTGRLYFITEIE